MNAQLLNEALANYGKTWRDVTGCELADRVSETEMQLVVNYLAFDPFIRLADNLVVLVNWMREHTGPRDGCHELLVDACHTLRFLGVNYMKLGGEQ